MQQGLAGRATEQERREAFSPVRIVSVSGTLNHFTLFSQAVLVDGLGLEGGDTGAKQGHGEWRTKGGRRLSATGPAAVAPTGVSPDGRLWVFSSSKSTRKGTLMCTREQLIKARLLVLALAQEPENICLVCKRADISKSQLYENETATKGSSGFIGVIGTTLKRCYVRIRIWEDDFRWPPANAFHWPSSLLAAFCLRGSPREGPAISRPQIGSADISMSRVRGFGGTQLPDVICRLAPNCPTIYQ